MMRRIVGSVWFVVAALVHAIAWYTWSVARGNEGTAIAHAVILPFLGWLLYKHGEIAGQRKILDPRRRR